MSMQILMNISKTMKSNIREILLKASDGRQSMCGVNIHNMVKALQQMQELVEGEDIEGTLPLSHNIQIDMRHTIHVLIRHAEKCEKALIKATINAEISNGIHTMMKDYKCIPNRITITKNLHSVIGEYLPKHIEIDVLDLTATQIDLEFIRLVHEYR